ncbi:hypothetical protein MY10362_007531 [Beauveria mimosiformis]
MTQTNVCTQSLLLIYYNTATIWMSTSLSPEELAYDAHVTAFGTIMSLASSIIKCRHPLLRRAAVKLLKKDELKNRRENLCHSNEAIAIALRTMELEEESIDESMVLADERVKDFGLESHSTAGV